MRKQRPPAACRYSSKTALSARCRGCGLGAVPNNIYPGTSHGVKAQLQKRCVTVGVEWAKTVGVLRFGQPVREI